MSNKILEYVLDLKEGKIKNLSYYDRTQIERELYLKIDSLVRKWYGIELGSFSQLRKQKLINIIEINKITEKHANIIWEGFEVYKLLASISSSDPYCEGDGDLSGAEEERKKLGIAIEKIFMV